MHASPEHDAIAAAVRRARAGAPPRSGNAIDMAAARAAFDVGLAFHGDASGVEVSSVELGGVPCERLDPPQPSGGHLLYLHGGAHTIGSPTSHRHLTTRLAAATGCTTWVTAHRLAPEHPCPAAVEDALAAYVALLVEADGPAAAAVAGDSAGGGLALSLLVAARNAGVAQPAMAALLSPWTDLTCASGAWTTNADDPALVPDDLRAQAAHYLGGRPGNDPVASPLFADLSGLAPIVIVAGGGELLLDDATVLASRLAAVGASPQLHIADGAMHAFVLFPGLPESVVALDLVTSRIRVATS